MKMRTTTREYDDEGRCVRETTVEYDYPDRAPYIVDSGQWWQPQPYPWTWPTITCGTVTNSNRVLVN